MLVATKEQQNSQKERPVMHKDLKGMFNSIKKDSYIRTHLIKALDTKPKIRLTDHWFICDDYSMKLPNQSMRLCAAFLREPNNSLSRNDIIDSLYASKAKKPFSSRLETSLNNSVVKLINRTKLIISEPFIKENRLLIEWFYFDPNKKKYKLYKIKKSYLKEKEDEILMVIENFIKIVEQLEKNHNDINSVSC